MNISKDLHRPDFSDISALSVLRFPPGWLSNLLHLSCEMASQSYDFLFKYISVGDSGVRRMHQYRVTGHGALPGGQVMSAPALHKPRIYGHRNGICLNLTNPDIRNPVCAFYHSAILLCA